MVSVESVSNIVSGESLCLSWSLESVSIMASSIISSMLYSCTCEIHNVYDSLPVLLQYLITNISRCLRKSMHVKPMLSIILA